MRVAIFGLGNFGYSLALKLTDMGHEVIGVDLSMERVEIIRDDITQAICLDSTHERAISMLPLQDLDLAVVGIGEDEGASLLTTALLRKLGVARVVSRAISSIHETVLESMGVEEIVHPEQDSAEKLAQRISLRGLIDSFELSEDYSIAEIQIPERFINLTVGEVNFETDHRVSLVTVLRTETTTNILGRSSETKRVTGIALPNTRLLAQDILVLFGKKNDLNKFSHA